MRSRIGVDKDTSFNKRDKNKINKVLLQATRKIKEVSLSASMTVESSLALPLFIFFFANIMMMFNIIKVQSDIEAALHQTGNEIALSAFDLRSAGDLVGIEDAESGVGQGLVSAVYTRSKVIDYLGEGIEKSCVTDGSSGLGFYNSRILFGNDLIDIVVDYRVHPLIPIIGFTEFPVEARYYGHAWTGYDLSGVEAVENPREEMVYVTEHGEVYHRDINCNHLKLTVKSVSYEQMKKERNKDGSRYKPCEYCAKNTRTGNVFITNYGDRYHTSTECSGLKRKIYTIPISEVGGRPPCSNCG